MNFTPTESRMLAVLSDGLPHSRKELHSCLFDDMGKETNIQPHISKLRNKLLQYGQTVLCEYYKRGFYYRHVRLLEPDG